MTGVDFMQKFTELHPHTPRIMLSGFAGILEAMAMVNGMGPIDLVAKPWEDEQLKQIIARLLQSNRGLKSTASTSVRRMPMAPQLQRTAARL